MIWENYFIRSGEQFSIFWGKYLKEKRDILLIMGIGFDPRTTIGIKNIYSVKSLGKRETTVLRYYKNENDSKGKNNYQVQKHIDDLRGFLKSKSFPGFTSKNIILRSNDDKNISSINATNIFNAEDIEGFSDIIIDISAIPRGIFLPIINKLLYLIEQKKKYGKKINLHLIVTENSLLDSHIHDIGEPDEATFLSSLGIIDTQKTRNYKEVWIALIGEGQQKQFEIIRKGINPADICLVIPFPSKDLRRGDKLLIEYQDLLFNDSSFNSKNIIYGDESNPFQIYRLIYKAIKRYDESFSILGGSKIIISALSSKLMTIGAFLAVYDLRKVKKTIGIKQVETIEHRFDPGIEENLDLILKNNILFEIWLTGIPYED